jgi:hypothetical protein
MAWSDCTAAINAAAGRELTDDEMDAILTALTRRSAHARRTGAALDEGQALREAAAEVAGDLAAAAAIERRNRALNLAKRAELSGWIAQHFPNNIAEGLEAIIAGVNRAKTGARNGAAQLQAMLTKRYAAGFSADIERSGHMKLFASGAMDREVGRALWAIGKADEADLLRGLPREAVEIARVVSKWQEVTRTDANAAGAWVRKYDGYITRQSHDAEKIRRAGFDAWKASALRRFDLDRMAAESQAESVDAMLLGIYTDLASGNHMHAVRDAEGSPFKGSFNVAKKVSESRTIHFRDADAWADYNGEFGTGNLRESIMRGLEQSGLSTGLMMKLGTNPEAMVQALKADALEAAKRAGDVDQVAKLADKENRLRNMMAAVDGTMNMPGNQTWARRLANVRALETMAKLGGMLLSQLNDVIIYAAGTKYQGRGFLSGMTEALSGLGRGMSDPARRELAASLGVVLENLPGELGRIGEFSEPGSMNSAVRTFMKWNGSQWWVDRMRTSAAFGMSHHMALQAGKAFDALDGEYRRVFSLYGIGEADWNAIRASAAKQVDGRAYVVPENVEGPAAEKLRTYLTDQTSYLALEPDARTRAVILNGTRPGTWSGEMARFLLQFKSFTGAYMQKVIGRELYGRGFEGDSIVGALRNGNGEMQGLAQLILMSTLAGYGSLALKDMAKGRTPRDPTESPEMLAKVLAASLVQGGGAGIYGDFLFGEANRVGGGTVESLAGPVISTGARVVDLYHRALRGDDVAAPAFREILNNTPYANLFYTRAALDYLIFYRIQESLNPGYLRRMEKRMQDEQNATFMFRPSEVVQ